MSGVVTIGGANRDCSRQRPLPDRHANNNASSRYGYITIWPADPPCVASERGITARGFMGPVLWSNDHGDGLKLRGIEASVPFPAALRLRPASASADRSRTRQRRQGWDADLRGLNPVDVVV